MRVEEATTRISYGSPGETKVTEMNKQKSIGPVEARAGEPLAASGLLNESLEAYVCIGVSGEYMLFARDKGVIGLLAAMYRRMKALAALLTFDASYHILPTALLLCGEVHYLRSGEPRHRLPYLQKYSKTQALRPTEQ